MSGIKLYWLQTVKHVEKGQDKKGIFLWTQNFYYFLTALVGKLHNEMNNMNYFLPLASDLAKLTVKFAPYYDWSADEELQFFGSELVM